MLIENLTADVVLASPRKLSQSSFLNVEVTLAIETVWEMNVLLRRGLCYIASGILYSCLMH